MLATALRSRQEQIEEAAAARMLWPQGGRFGVTEAAALPRPLRHRLRCSATGTGRASQERQPGIGESQAHGSRRR